MSRKINRAYKQCMNTKSRRAYTKGSAKKQSNRARRRLSKILCTI